MMTVPTQLVLPFYEAWAETVTKPRETLAEILHASGSTVKQMLDGDQLTLKATDRLLTAIERVDVWHVELADYYEVAA